MKVKITGTGSCLPKLRVTNDDLGQIMETSDEWIRSRTGITARHIAVEETTTGMSTEAADKALKNAEISAEDVDIIIAATVSADKHLPGLACEVQKNIGAENAVAFDINGSVFRFSFCTRYCGAVFRTWRISACACDWSGNAVKNDGLDGPEHLRAFWGRRRGSSSFSK